MKTIFIFLLFISTNVLAQKDSTFKFDEMAWHNKSANEYAKGGMILILAGDALAIYFLDQKFDKSTFLFPVGLSVAGFAMLGVSISHTIKYRKLNHTKVELSFNNGIGIVFHLN